MDQQIQNLKVLARLRKTLKITQEEMAAAIGMSQASYSLLENGEIELKVKHVKLIAEKLKMDGAELYVLLFLPTDLPKSQIEPLVV